MADVEMARVAAYVAAGVCMGLGAFGPALGLGFIGGKACESIAKKPESYSDINRSMILALAMVESVAIYVLLISLLLISK